MTKVISTLLNFQPSQIEELVQESFSFAEIVRKLNCYPNTRNISYIRGVLEDMGISTKHFTSNGSKPTITIDKVCPVCCKNFSAVDSRQVTCSRACSNTYFRSGPRNGNYIHGKSTYRDKALRYYNNACYNCKTTDIRVLQVHHIDGNRYNNDIDNLRILCANCHLLSHKQ